MRKYLFSILALVIAFASVGCASGAPATIDRSAAPQSVVAANTLGFRPEVQAFLGMPIDVTDCVTDTATNVVKDLVGGARCVLNKLVPIVSPPAAPAYATQAAPCFVDEQVTEMVPETTTRMVPRTRTIRRAVPQTAPAPAPQKSPGCEPPPSPVACVDGNCGLHR